MGVTDSIALALEKECNDLVGAIDGGLGLERDGGLTVLTS
jgi:hypothetical protein